jgi:hypothetical protein
MGTGNKRGVFFLGEERFHIAPNQAVPGFVTERKQGWQFESWDPGKGGDECGWCWSVFSTHRNALGTIVGSEVSHSVSIRFWVIAVAFSILPALRVREFVRQRRLARQGKCATCGYDLRATPDRCPECGAIPSQRTEASAQAS